VQWLRVNVDGSKISTVCQCLRLEDTEKKLERYERKGGNTSFQSQSDHKLVYIHADHL